MKRFSLIISLLIFCCQLDAQTVSEARCIRTTALMVYDGYVGIMNRLNDGFSSNEIDFVKMFVEETDSVFNDILIDGEDVWLTPRQYYYLYTSQIKKTDYHFSDFYMGEPISDGDKWVIDVYFSRDVEFPGATVELPPWRFRYAMRIIMEKERTPDKVFSNALIKKISIVDSASSVVVIVNPQKIPLILRDRQIRGYNTDCNCIITDLDGESPADIQTGIDNPFYPIVVDKTGNVYEFYRQLYDIWGVRASVAPYGIGNTPALMNNGITGSNKSLCLGAFYGKYMISTYRDVGFVNIGLELINKNINYRSTITYSYCIPLQVDEDGDIYDRNISLFLNHEKWNIYGVTLPVSFSYLFNLTPYAHRHFYLSTELGFFVTYRAVHALSYNLNASYSGTYHQYWDVEMDHYYDYGDYVLTDGRCSANGKIKYFDYGVSLGVGLCYQLSRESFVRFDMALRKGFVLELENNKNRHLTTDYNNYNPVLGFSGYALDPYIGLSFILLRPISK